MSPDTIAELAGFTELPIVPVSAEGKRSLTWRNANVRALATRLADAMKISPGVSFDWIAGAIRGGCTVIERPINLSRDGPTCSLTHASAPQSTQCRGNELAPPGGVALGC